MTPPLVDLEITVTARCPRPAVARAVQTTESVVGKPIPGALRGAVIASFVLLGVSPPPVALAGLSETRGRCRGELAASISGSL
jgi:hypothetical protein